MASNYVSRSLHELGLAAWFGGALMGAVGLRTGAGEAGGRRPRLRVEDEGWKRWQPVQQAAIGAYVLGSLGVTWGNRGRMGAQQGVASTAAVKTVLTGAAIAATVAAAKNGGELARAATQDDITTSELDRLEGRQRQLQCAVPALTGALLVVNAVMGEQQRPSQVAGGIRGRLRRHD